MKKMILMAFAAVLITGCAKDGDPGAQGPAGNANVKSFSFSPVPGDWLTYGTPGNGDHSKYVEFSIPEITQSIIDDGMVLVYLGDASGTAQLPLTLFASSTSWLTLTAFAEVGKAEVDIQLNSLQTPNTASLNWDFKVVVVSGFNRITHPEINWKDYESVKKLID